jgi:hypothetical protein
LSSNTIRGYPVILSEDQKNALLKITCNLKQSLILAKKVKKSIKLINNDDTLYDLDYFGVLDKNEEYRKLIILPLVYDSYSESEGEEEVESEKMVIFPNNYFRGILEYLTLISNFYIMILNPLSFTYIISHYSILILVVVLIIDMLYILDLVSSFFTGYYDL